MQVARRRPATRPELGDIVGWAIVPGIIGGRLYHVLTDPELYFGPGRHPRDAVKLCDGGLGIWGAIALIGVGTWVGGRRAGIRLAVFAAGVVVFLARRPRTRTGSAPATAPVPTP